MKTILGQIFHEATVSLALLGAVTLNIMRQINTTVAMRVL